MKRFFTLFMAFWALLSISQTVKAADVTVYFLCPDTGFEVIDNDNHVYTSAGDQGTLSKFEKKASYKMV